MKGDFSRDTFDPKKHFSRVLQQQGRVQLDADWNEQTAILLHYLRTLAADLIGPFAGPAGDDALGFQINPVKNSNSGDFVIGKGRYYVDGILCENEADKDVSYATQENFPNPPPLPTPSGGPHSYLVYLDVWERHVTALEDDAIREKALGGADTATRAKVVWQVKIWAGKLVSQSDRAKILNDWKQWVEKFQPSPRGCLSARAKPPKDTKDPCLTAPDAKYRGSENQLYRVEIHKGGKAEVATFKWSRDNGAIVTTCELKGTELTVTNSRGFATNQWVELTNDGLELRGQPGILVKVTKVEGDTLTLYAKPDVPEDLREQEKWPTKVRRWDQHEGKDMKVDKDGVQFTETDGDKWIDLEDGIQIQFLKPSEKNVTTQYCTGDYWLIPARVATGDIEWPDVNEGGKQVRASKPPNGILHHYAPLAILTPNSTPNSSNWIVNNGDDLRCKFYPLNNNCGLSYSYGEEGIGGHLLCNPPAKVRT